MSSSAVSTLWHRKAVTSLSFYPLAKYYCTVQSSFGSVRLTDGPIPKEEEVTEAGSCSSRPDDEGCSL